MTSRFAAPEVLNRSTTQAHIVDAFLHEDGAQYEILRVAPGEWRAVWQRQQPRELLLLATFYVESESDARAALIDVVWEALHGAGSQAIPPSTMSLQ